MIHFHTVYLIKPGMSQTLGCFDGGILYFQRACSIPDANGLSPDSGVGLWLFMDFLCTI